MLDEEQQSRKRYKKDLVHLKPDLAAYNAQKEIALGLEPGTLKAGSSAASSSLTAFNPQGNAVSIFQPSSFIFWSLNDISQVASYEQQRAAESLYRDANTLLYADNKPTEDAIDRVVGKLNFEYVLSFLSKVSLLLIVTTRPL